jgi:hypothetical protein
MSRAGSSTTTPLNKAPVPRDPRLVRSKSSRLNTEWCTFHPAFHSIKLFTNCYKYRLYIRISCRVISILCVQYPLPWCDFLKRLLNSPGNEIRWHGLIDRGFPLTWTNLLPLCHRPQTSPSLIDSNHLPRKHVPFDFGPPDMYLPCHEFLLAWTPPDMDISPDSNLPFLLGQ